MSNDKSKEDERKEDERKEVNAVPGITGKKIFVDDPYPDKTMHNIMSNSNIMCSSGLQLYSVIDEGDQYYVVVDKEGIAKATLKNNCIVQTVIMKSPIR